MPLLAQIGEAGVGEAVAELVLPLPPRGQNYPMLQVRIGGEAAAALVLPDLEQERRALIDTALLLFAPFVFSGEEFPRAEFEQPSLIEDALGPYTLQTTFYDATYHRVARAQTPGRYGAVTEVKPERGQAFKRFTTLYRQEKPLDWSQTQAVFTGELPPEMGVEAGVLGERRALWSDFLKQQLQQGFTRDSRSGVLLAGLHEAKVGDGSGSWNNPGHRDDTWWYGLKKRIGETPTTAYLLDLPQGYEADTARQWPLVIFLHGSGERGSDLSKLRRHGPPELVAQGKQFPFILVSPQAKAGYLIGTQIIEVLDEVARKYRVDTDRVILTGLSLGGNSTWFTALEFPERFAAIVPIAATTDPANMPRLRQLPTWLFEGGKDTNITQGRVTLMVEAMKAAGVPFKFTLYPEAGHGESWKKAYDDPALYEWMLAQRRAK